ncbi:hypothetical protein ACFLRU_05475 [Bacteroidota bacterium]
MKKKYFVLIAIMSLSFLNAQSSKSFDKTTSFILLKQRSTNWSSQSYLGSIETDADMFSALEFSANVYKKLSIGGIINFSNKTNDFSNYALKLAYGNIGFSYEKGKITGAISPGQLNDISNYNEDENFQGSFEYFAVYNFGLDGALRLGVGYLNFVSPTDTSINYTTNNSFDYGSDFLNDHTFTYIDPATKNSIFGFYASIDTFTSAISNGNIFTRKKKGIYFYPTLFIGASRTKSSSFRTVQIENFISSEIGTNISLKYKDQWGVGADMRQELGYHFTGDFKNLDMKYGIALGADFCINYRFQFSGGDDIEDLTPATDNPLYYYWGPFIRGGIVF